MNQSLAWDYTLLSRSYHKRPNYPRQMIAKICERTGLGVGNKVCDIGAGTGNLSILLAERGMLVEAVEPNPGMYDHRVPGARNNPMISWVNTTAEDTGLISHDFDAVSFGSSFNVVDREVALQESLRICKPGGWLVTIWNHRDLSEPLQQSIEACIKDRLPGYDYGLRRIDQRGYLESSGLFSRIELLETTMLIKQPVVDVVEAWRSHATLKRQAGDAFDDIINEIELLLEKQGSDTIETPYTSRAWVSRFHNGADSGSD